ncbi:MAG: cysteine methyltransferase [Chloroflexi bacterium]|nr:cysteine methyltransferase [Chloroflexota bacterium]
MSSWKVINIEIGDILIQVSTVGVQKIQYFDDKSDIKLDNETISSSSDFSDKNILDSTVNQLNEYFSGNRGEFNLPFDLLGTEFQIKVWLELQSITFGETTTYGAIASGIGHPHASRAVGGALNKNPISIVLPCHRVIGANGLLTGYGGGMERKIWLLEHEQGKT